MTFDLRGHKVLENEYQLDLVRVDLKIAFDSVFMNDCLSYFLIKTSLEKLQNMIFKCPMQNLFLLVYFSMVHCGHIFQH